MIETSGSQPSVYTGLGRAIYKGAARNSVDLIMVLLIALVVIFPVADSHAQISDPFVVENLEVDETGESAAAARDKALALGEVRAFNTLLRRLTMQSDHARLPVLQRREIARYLQAFAVANEKTSTIRYLASLTYTFKSDEVRRFLREAGFEFAETRSKPVLVLPVFRSAGVIVLWDDPNPWRTAWASVTASGGLVPLKLPRGDLTDIAALGAEQAAAGDRQRLRAIARRYRVGDVIVALATRSAGPGGSTSLQIDVNRYGTGERDQTIITTVTAEPSETITEVTARAAVEVALKIEDQWKQDNLIQFGQSSILAVRLPLKSLGDWVKTKARLGSVAVINRSDLVLLSRDEALINLHYLGSPEQLSLALSQADLTLSEDQSGWKLTLEDNLDANDNSNLPAQNVRPNDRPAVPGTRGDAT